MHLIDRHLSLWEVAHRWNGIDPQASDAASLPIAVRDTLRTLSLALYNEKLHVLDDTGCMLGQRRDYHCLAEHEPREPENKVAEYIEYMRVKVGCNDEITTALHQNVQEQVFELEQLHSIFLSREEVKEFCQEQQMPLPEFWFPEPEPTFWQSVTGWLSGASARAASDPISQGPAPTHDVKDAEQVQANGGADKLRPEQEDKLRCQDIAQALWAQNPNMTIAAVIVSPEIQREGNGAQYTPKTLRNWVKEVDPRPPEQKRGRPRKDST